MDKISLNNAGYVGKTLSAGETKPVSGSFTPEVSEKIAKDLEKYMQFASLLGQSLVKKPLEDFNNGCGSIWDGIKELDSLVGKVDNVFENVEAFKEAGGTFDKEGHALINGKPFVGVIRTGYTPHKIMPLHSDRQYAFFCKEGTLYQVISVEDNGNTVVKDKIDCANPGSSACSICTQREVYSTTFGMQGHDTLLRRYGIINHF